MKALEIAKTDRRMDDAWMDLFAIQQTREEHANSCTRGLW